VAGGDGEPGVPPSCCTVRLAGAAGSELRANAPRLAGLLCWRLNREEAWGREGREARTEETAQQQEVVHEP